FKKVFLKKHILKAFLNTVLEAELPAPITDVSYQPTDFIVKGKPRLIQKSKHDVIDIFCITAQDERILIELQKGSDSRAHPRFLDYQCRNYSSQFPTGSDYTTVMPCYSICWFFDLKPPHKHVKEIISLRSNHKHTNWMFAWKIVVLYPRNIPKTHIEQKHVNKLEEWLLLDMIDDVKDAKKLQELIHTEAVQEAFETLDLSNLTEDQLRRMFFEEQILPEYRDVYEEHVQKATRKAERKTKRKTKRKTERKTKRKTKRTEKRAIARQLLDVLDIETISHKTGLSKGEVKQLQKDMS
ncbi:MAG: Rpn family recombination-promoting nuclease/putative transposase, partial [Planctomycetes bacterium]|nr:Rpn family recombination-promoting nuclease/putative transposase [Planctomycetota bacterium]